MTTQTTPKPKLTILCLLLLTVVLVACGAQTANRYTVKPGDTLAQIAADHGVSVDALVELNQGRYPSLKTDPDLIEVGWKLQLPGSAVSSGSDDAPGDPSWPYPTPSPPASPTAATLSREAFELEVVRLANEERAKAGLGALEVDPDLMAFARARSEDMAARGYFSHFDPGTGEDLSGSAGENIRRTRTGVVVLTPDLAARAVSGWMNSQGHRANILHETIRYTGVGVAADFREKKSFIITQLFK